MSTSVGRLETIVMRNIKVVLAYDGSDFSGWQVQPFAATIQGALAWAIGRVTGEKVLPQGSGRTDAGVHALAKWPHLRWNHRSRRKTWGKRSMIFCRLRFGCWKPSKLPTNFMPANRPVPRPIATACIAVRFVPLSGSLRVAPSIFAERGRDEAGRRVIRGRARFHLVCGGGSGARSKKKLRMCEKCSARVGSGRVRN